MTGVLLLAPSLGHLELHWQGFTPSIVPSEHCGPSSGWHWGSCPFPRASLGRELGWGLCFPPQTRFPPGNLQTKLSVRIWEQ